MCHALTYGVLHEREIFNNTKLLNFQYKKFFLSGLLFVFYFDTSGKDFNMSLTRQQFKQLFHM